MKVSIITPCYNSAAYIEHCIKSVVSQSNDHLEHIIVDGGSSDGTVDVIRKYESMYNMKWISEKDSGMYDAIAKGFRMATGDIMSWLNSDDIYYPWTIDTVISVMSQHSNVNWLTGIPSNLSKAGILYSPTNYQAKMYSQKAIMTGKHHGKGHGFIQQESTFWSRQLWENAGGINAQMKYAGDFDLWRRFAKYHKLHTVDCILASFRIHDGQKSTDMISYYSEIREYCTYAQFLYWLMDKAFGINRLYSLCNRKNLIRVTPAGKTIANNASSVKLYVKEILMR